MSAELLKIPYFLNDPSDEAALFLAMKLVTATNFLASNNSLLNVDVDLCNGSNGESRWMDAAFAGFSDVYQTESGLYVRSMHRGRSGDFRVTLRGTGLVSHIQEFGQILGLNEVDNLEQLRKSDNFLITDIIPAPIARYSLPKSPKGTIYGKLLEE
jgi:hypothetical protein